MITAQFDVCCTFDIFKACSWPHGTLKRLQQTNGRSVFIAVLVTVEFAAACQNLYSSI